jgi:hypothetical protein
MPTNVNKFQPSLASISQLKNFGQSEAGYASTVGREIKHEIGRRSK